MYEKIPERAAENIKYEFINFCVLPENIELFFSHFFKYNTNQYNRNTICRMSLKNPIWKGSLKRNQTVLMDLLNIVLFPWKKSAPFYLSLSPYVCSSLGMFVYIVYSYHLYLRGYQSQTKPNGGLKQWGCALVVSYPPFRKSFSSSETW